MLKSNLIVLHYQVFFLGQLNSLLSLFSKMHWVLPSKINLAYLPCPEDKGLVPGALGYGIICKFMQTLERKSWGILHIMNHKSDFDESLIKWCLDRVQRSSFSVWKWKPWFKGKRWDWADTFCCLQTEWDLLLQALLGAMPTLHYTALIRTTGKIGWFVYDYKLQFQLTRMS